MNTNRYNLTPAEIGLLAATADEATAAGYGDDDTLAQIVEVALYEQMAPTVLDAWRLASGFFYADR